MTPLPRTAAALWDYYRTMSLRSTHWDNVKTNEDAELAEILEEDSLRKVQVAFHLDTRDINAMDKVLCLRINEFIGMLGKLGPELEQVAKREQLKVEAQKQALWQFHDELTNWEDISPEKAMAYCTLCTERISVVVQKDGNQSDIFGLSYKCKKNPRPAVKDPQHRIQG